jgi:hypothetical protein
MPDDHDTQRPQPQTEEPPPTPPPPGDELVDEMEEESFPASDPPSTWAGPSSA